MKIYLWQRAAAFAAKAHEGQYRKDGLTPYVSHPFRVAMTLQHVFGINAEDILAAAILHDVLEDTTHDFDDLSREFGTRIAKWVALLSKDKRLPEGVRKDVYYEALRKAPVEVKLIKLADLFDNYCDSSYPRSPKKEKIRKRLLSFIAECTAEKDNRFRDVLGILKHELSR